MVVVATGEFSKPASDSQEGLTGAVFVAAMQQARKLGLRLKPLRYFPTYRMPISFEDDDR